MKILRKLAAVLFLLIFTFQFVNITVLAVPVEHDGIEFSIETDKENYEPEENINAVITVKNNNDYSVSIADLEQIVPEGYKIKEDAETSLKDIQLLPGETIELEVIFESETETVSETEPETFFDKVIYGESFGIPNLLIAFVFIIVIALFFYFT